ncbi:MAG: stilbene synthase [Luteolibacter sp.]
MYLSALATANPPHTFTQAETWKALHAHPQFGEIKPRSVTLLEKILTNSSSGIGHRQFTSPDLGPVFRRDAQQLNHSFEKEAPKLSAAALAKAIEQAGIRAEDIDALFLCTCTGYLCPGPSSHVAEIAGLRPDTYLCDLVGLGCGAAIPTLRAAHGYLAANPTHTVAMIAVEISSAAFYIDDDPGVLISLCLFGDGAAAAILTGQDSSRSAWQFHDFDTHHVPADREKIRFTNSAGKLKNQLHRSVPDLAAKAVSTLYNRRLSDPQQILAHSGGRDVIEAIETELPPFQLTETRQVLADHGNMSSPSVLYALANRLKTHPEDTSLWLTAFGAGFAAHSCHLSRKL